ncbi:heptose-I-phosphate ethanolaminephosphotransferase [Variovorax boronicumulans]|uniref:Heptose-I-phosphate ethanolaminephosphotransferase n=1 Tax=Variovorax boronicumulans TaxID=436515 RepID=A0AAW8DDX1_9BURK|nr:phosphoethanolamine transferase [Variovorax boronicumulans]MDP9897560.1 heptose-I-phosphate ethanolaminephosphotransferase [Variovorax boronicumulans]MDQ0057599.1 heptose-I-phosphate ethanolaminephosphotransferase [Variovorax boronicumulans]
MRGRRIRTLRLASLTRLTSSPSDTPAPRDASRHSALLACGVVGATLLALIALGHDGRRIAQLAVLAAPMVLWLAWPLRSARMRNMRTVLVWLWAMGFALDAAVRAYLLDTYQAAPDGAMVLGAAANTNARESTEYLWMHWRSAVIWSGALAVTGVLVGMFARRGAAFDAGASSVRAPRSPFWVRSLVLVLLLVACVAYASKPWRRLHPAIFWAGWSQSVHAQRAAWAGQEKVRDRLMAQAKAIAPVALQAGPSTVVLVITDSINRDNMALYGYGRPTTPRLLAHKAQAGEQMAVLKNAWSVDASTLPALRNMFHFGLPESENPPHLLALARAAGYKVWWISNHDDLAIEQQHARLADVVDMVNRTPGRASASLDGEILDCVQEAFADTSTDRKLIVVHLMGAHPHYSLRFPENANPFDDDVDAVENGLVKDGRSAWVRRFRQEYDAALLYHDFVVSELLQQTRTAGKPAEDRAWMYVSDHGQEVGHGSDRAGHSPSTASGYRIPTVIWRNREPLPNAAAQQQPFRADWTGWALMDLLKIQWSGQVPERNVLGDAYRWLAPAIPVAVESFSR